MKKNKVAKILKIKGRINQEVLRDKFPSTVKIGNDKYGVEYSLNKLLDSYVKKLLKRHKSDYSSIIVLDNNTGDILSATGYDKSASSFAPHLAFSTTHPSASLFKIVTTATLLNKGKVDNKTLFTYRGKGSTLYKYQLKRKFDRWTRKQSLENAFAHSNNVVFGKAAITQLTGVGIFNMANKFGFNKKLMNDLNLSASTFKMPNDQYHLAELATGFNKQTLISPIHAAVLSSIIANGGVLRAPRIIKKIQSNGKVLWENESDSTKVLSPVVNSKLEKMMGLVVKKGTARSINRGLKKIIRNSLNIGGKTGSITGGIPYGKRDWLTLYAIPEKDGHSQKQQDLGISIAVMNINVKKWYVKSSFLAKKIIEYYYKEIKPIVKKKISKSGLKNKKATGV